MSRPVDRPVTSFEQPELLPGRGPAELLPWLLQALAMLGDLAAFYLVLAVRLRGAPLTLIAVACGFAAVAVLGAHGAGVLLARLRCGDPRASRALLALVAGVWLALGVIAFVARAAAGPGGGSTTFGSAVATGTGDLIAALLFLALYLGSGTAAVLAAYLQHNPLAAALRRAARVLARAVRREAASRAHLVRAVAVLEQQIGELDRESVRHQAARRALLAEMAALQNEARVRMAIGKQDPAHTDGVTGSGPDPELALPPVHLPPAR
jgi:hypothetical protein